MTFTECCECGRPASRFWGRYAYCRTDLDGALVEDPKAHSCPACDEEQPPQVMWRRDRPCNKCHLEEGNRGL